MRYVFVNRRFWLVKSRLEFLDMRFCVIDFVGERKWRRRKRRR